MAGFSFLYVIAEGKKRTRVEPFYQNMERAEILPATGVGGTNTEKTEA